MKKVIKNISNVLFPNGFKCIVCGEEIAAGGKFNICENCFNSLPKINTNTCNKCGEPINISSKYCEFCKNEMPAFTKCFAPFLFSDNIVKLIHELKYDNKVYLAKTLSNLMVASYLKENVNCNVVIPVPLNFNRENSRGFNQAELLCVGFKNIGMEVDTISVVRSKNTLTQTNLTKKQRRENVENAFTVVNKGNIKGKNILLVDDVYTTGATLNSLAGTLKSAGAKEVYGVTLAHTVIK